MSRSFFIYGKLVVGFVRLNALFLKQCWFESRCLQDPWQTPKNIGRWRCDGEEYDKRKDLLKNVLPRVRSQQ